MKAGDCIFYQIAKINQWASRFSGKKLEHFGITSVQGMILLFLSEEDGVSSNRLGEKIQLDSATLTGIIDRLESRNLIKRSPDSEDRRAIRIHLTSEGKKTATEINKVMVKANREFYSLLTENEKEAFRSVIQKIRNAKDLSQ